MCVTRRSLQSQRDYQSQWITWTSRSHRQEVDNILQNSMSLPGSLLLSLLTYICPADVFISTLNQPNKNKEIACLKYMTGRFVTNHKKSLLRWIIQCHPLLIPLTVADDTRSCWEMFGNPIIGQDVKIYLWFFTQYILLNQNTWL